jgi:iron complex transport system substrate-binding protein
MGVYSFIDDAMYDKLWQIAPTVAATKANASDRWQGQTLITGRALGREQQAQEVVDRVEGRFAEAREEHPEFEGKTLAYALLGEGGANTYSLEATDLRTQLFTSLGFEMTKSTGEISREKMSLLDEDVLVTAGLSDAREAEVPVLPQLAEATGKES